MGPAALLRSLGEAGRRARHRTAGPRGRVVIARTTVTLVADDVIADLLDLCEAGLEYRGLQRKLVRPEAVRAIELLRGVHRRVLSEGMSSVEVPFVGTAEPADDKFCTVNEIASKARCSAS